MDIAQLLAFSVKNGASDLHLSAGLPPMIRVDGDVRRINVDPMDHEKVHGMVYDIMNDKQRKSFEEFLETDFSFEIPGLARFRVNAFNQNRGAGAVFRTIPSKILTLEELGAPKIFEDIADTPRGMVLVTGPTGSGKSTTLAGMVNYVNENHYGHILTIEDPIEFVFTQDKCLINQRELGQDVVDFHVAMKHAVREDPDIMLVGEMRDMDTFETAIHAAETGHLVFGTIHASSAPTTIVRILDLFPEEMHNAIRSAIAFNLKAIVAQKLLPSIKPGVGRVPTVEIMIFTPTIKKLVLEAQDNKLPDAIRIGAEEGMQDFTMSLKQLVDDELIDRPTAFEVAPNREALKMALKGIYVSQPGIL